jgi:hypothetical protein
MVFAKRLREGVKQGRITCTVRIWKHLHVRVGGRYRVDEGEIEVEAIDPIGLPDITPKIGPRVRIRRRAGSPQGRETRDRGQDIFDSLPLYSTAYTVDPTTAE